MTAFGQRFCLDLSYDALSWRRHQPALADLCLSGCFSKTQYIVLSLCWTALEDPRRPVSAHKMWVCARFQGRARFGTQPWVACADCGERRIHQDKPGVDRGLPRDGFRSAIPGVTNRAVCQRKHRLRTFAHVDSQRLRASHMLKSRFLQPSKALEAVGMYSGAWHHILFQENSGA